MRSRVSVTCAHDPSQRPLDFYQEGFDVSFWRDILVPGNWEVQGCDKPIYTNITYPWTGVESPRPPFAPTRYNPVGSYKRSFTLPDGWNGRRTFLSFQGVSSAFYVWINGQYVGYGEDSFQSQRQTLHAISPLRLQAGGDALRY